MGHEYYFCFKRITLSKLYYNKHKKKYAFRIVIHNLNLSKPKTSFEFFLIKDYKKNRYVYKKIKKIFKRYKLNNKNHVAIIFNITNNYPRAFGIRKNIESMYDSFFLLFQQEYLDRIPKDLFSEYLWMDIFKEFNIVEFSDLKIL